MSTRERDVERPRIDPSHAALLAAIVIPYGLLRAAGVASSTAMLSGMARAPSDVALGALYVVLHLLAWVAAPCLAVAAALDVVLVRWTRARTGSGRLMAGRDPAATRRSLLERKP